jgi:MOSC domain-containing protein YiiM
MSNKISGNVQGLFISSKEHPRQYVESIQVDENGIVGDKFYAKDLQRSILIASTQSYEIAKENGIFVEYGLLGENILLDINPYGLKAGDRIKIGEVVLEITQNCTICNSLSKVNKELPNLLKTDRGIFSKTYISGTINIYDEVSVIVL